MSRNHQDSEERFAPGSPTIDTFHLSEMLNRLERIELAIAQLVQQRKIKQWYTTAEVADFLGKAEFTVREWCRLGRVRAEKRTCGRGNSQEWIVSHDELQRVGNEGLLPDPARYRHVK